MKLWRWLRSKLSAKKMAEDAAIAAAKVAVDEIAKVSGDERAVGMKFPSTLTEDERMFVLELAPIMGFDGNMERGEAVREPFDDFRRGPWKEGWDD